MDPTLLEEAVEPIVMTPEPAGPGAGAMSMASSTSSSQTVLELRALYLYDAFNRRVARFVPGVSYFSYTWDGWQEAEEYRNLVVGSQYVWGEQLDELIAYRHKADTANVTWANYYVAEGGAHCPSRILNSSGQVVEIQEYDPYGRTYRFTGNGTLLLQANGTPNQVGAVGNPFGWKGHRVDGETGLVYMRNRYYHTGWGRFLSQDWLGIHADRGNLGNAYAYAWERPLVASDRMGLQTSTIEFVRDNAGYYASVSGPGDFGKRKMIKAPSVPAGMEGMPTFTLSLKDSEIEKLYNESKESGSEDYVGNLSDYEKWLYNNIKSKMPAWMGTAAKSLLMAMIVYETVCGVKDVLALRKALAMLGEKLAKKLADSKSVRDGLKESSRRAVREGAEASRGLQSLQKKIDRGDKGWSGPKTQENAEGLIDEIVKNAQSAEGRVRPDGSIVVDMWDGKGRGIRMIDGEFDTFLSVAEGKK